jgi:hypothetical protein
MDKFHEKRLHIQFSRTQIGPQNSKHETKDRPSRFQRNKIHTSAIRLEQTPDKLNTTSAIQYTSTKSLRDPPHIEQNIDFQTEYDSVAKSIEETVTALSWLIQKKKTEKLGIRQHH